MVMEVDLPCPLIQAEWTDNSLFEIKAPPRTAVARGAEIGSVDACHFAGFVYAPVECKIVEWLVPLLGRVDVGRPLVRIECEVPLAAGVIHPRAGGPLPADVGEARTLRVRTVSQAASGGSYFVDFQIDVEGAANGWWILEGPLMSGQDLVYWKDVWPALVEGFRTGLATGTGDRCYPWVHGRIHDFKYHPIDFKPAKYRQALIKALGEWAASLPPAP
jgi:hypothetical protein